MNEAWLADALAQLKTRGDAVARLGCLGLPAPVLNDLCRRLIVAAGGGGSADDVVEWLQGEVAEAPSRSAIYRFRGYLLEEYRAARSVDARRRALAQVNDLAEGEPEALQLAISTRLAERLGDMIDGTDDLTALDPKALDALVKGVRMVCQTAFDKRKMDKALERATAQVKKLDQDIAIRDAKLAEARRQQQQALAAAEKAAAGGGKSADAVVAAIKQALGIGDSA